MNYDMSAQKFLEKSEAGGIDYQGFVQYVMEKTKNMDIEFNFMQCMADFDKRIDLKPPLHGLPISVKDCICVKGVQSSAGSKILDGYKPPFDATAVDRAEQKGGRVLCKTNQDSFGFGTFSINSDYGIPKNPLDTSLSCGGSSGGAACLTKLADFPHIALAQSTGGSISCPAAFCGVVGLTPTYGLVSRYGLIDYANSLDKIGPIGKCVYDVALLLSIISGKDERDQTTLDIKQKDYTKCLNKEIKGLKIGVPKEYFHNIDTAIEKEVWNAIKQLESLGATVKEISLPSTAFALSAYYIIATCEASTNLAKFCGMRYGSALELKGNFDEYFSEVRSTFFNEESKRRIMLGTFARMSGYRNQYYMKALKVRAMIIKEFKNTFKKIDVLAAPTMPILSPKITEAKKLTPAQQYSMDILTVPANLAGLPMISLPCSGKPIGLHLIGDHLQEEKILQAAQAYENKENKI